MISALHRRMERCSLDTICLSSAKRLSPSPETVCQPFSGHRQLNASNRKGIDASVAVIPGGGSHAYYTFQGIVVKHHIPTAAEALDIAVDHREDRTIVRLNGHVGIDSSPDLRDRLFSILREQTPKNLTVDLNEVAYIDTSGIATLLEALKIARHHGTELCLEGLQGRMVRLFETTGLKTLFEASGCKSISSASKVN
jgi:anti-sigma B factor antagonist